MGRKRKHDPDVVLNFIKRYKAENTGRSPSVREIGDGCGISSVSVVRNILTHLRHIGKVVSWGGQRNIVLPSERWFVEDIVE